MPKAKILIIDDNDTALDGLKGILEHAGYEVTISQDSRKALKLVEENKFDLIYTDMRMPGLDGADVCKRIKKISPETPVILFSGTPHGVANRQVDFLKSGGIDKYMRKPLFREEVLKVTEEILKEYDKEPE